MWEYLRRLDPVTGMSEWFRDPTDLPHAGPTVRSSDPTTRRAPGCASARGPSRRPRLMAECPLASHNVRAAYNAGVEATERALLPFDGVDRVRFSRDLPQFAAAVAYERDLLTHLHRMQSRLQEARATMEDAAEHQAEVARKARDRVASTAGPSRVASAMRRIVARVRASAERQRAKARFHDAIRVHRNRRSLVARLTSELAAVRVWLDEQVDVVEAYAQARAGRRRENELPGSAVPYSTPAFLAADPAARALQPGSDVPGGADYGHEWTWELPGRPWEVTRWMVSWLDNGEIYARDVTYGGDPAKSRLGDHAVLLLGNVPRPGLFRENFLAQIQVSMKPSERNTLVLVARAVGEHEMRLKDGGEAAV